MSDARYDELLGRLLDHDLSETEAAELAALASRRPEGRSDVRQHLRMWDLFEQQHAEERSTEAFVRAWRMRLTAEADANGFVGRVAARLVDGKSDALSEAIPSKSIPSKANRELSEKIILVNWRFVVSFAACIVLMLGVGAWLFGPIIGQPVLSDVTGTGTSIERGNEFLLATKGMTLRPGETLRVGTNASASIHFGAEQTRMNLSGGAELRLASLASGKRFELREGTLEAEVARQRPFRPLMINTPNAEARVMGTKFTLTVSTNRTQLDVTEGKVRLADMFNPNVKPADVVAGHQATVAPATELAALPQTGWIFREYWTNWPGGNVGIDLTLQPAFPDHPNGREWVDRLETPNVWGHDYGARWRGFLHPPISGDYRLALDAADYAHLYLSTNAEPANKIIVLESGVVSREDLNSNSPVSMFNLKAGRRYYLEVLHKAGKGRDHLSVSWKRPDGEIEIIPGKFLSPFKPKPKERK